MTKNLLLFAFCLILSTSFGQKFSYSFEGQLNEQQEEMLKKQISILPDVLSYKVKYKPDSYRGELLIQVKEFEGQTENRSDFTPAMIKELFLENGLTPLEFNISK